MSQSDITIIIKTVERPRCLMRLLDSIEASRFDGQVIVADDSREPYEKEMRMKHENLLSHYIVLPYDSGCSAGRNAALAKVDTEFFLLCDDDFVFDDHVRLSWMRDTVRKEELDLLGGLVYEKGWVRRYAGNFEVENGTLRHVAIDYQPDYTCCDIVLNFFLARTEAVRTKVGGWNEKLKTNEHSEFFFRAKQGGLIVAHTDEVGIGHMPESSESYNQLRHRRAVQFDQICLRECGIHTWHSLDGSITRLKDTSALKNATPFRGS